MKGREGLFNPSSVIAEMMADEWETHNTLDEGTDAERDMKMPADSIIRIGKSGPGRSSRKLPSTIRAQPVLYVWDNDAIDPEQGDVHYLTEDMSATVRLQIVVANGLNGRDGDDTRNDYIRVINAIRQANRCPPGGVGGSRWSTIKPGTIDRTPTEYSEQWRANIDFQLSAENVSI